MTVKEQKILIRKGFRLFQRAIETWNKAGKIRFSELKKCKAR